MAGQKHKSKWKAPKDLEKSQKIEARKDLKDYTHEDKDGGMNPYSTNEKADLVHRKNDKLVIDDVENMVPEIKHRIYQDVETGKYSPKEAKKIFKKLQIEDTEGYLEKLETRDGGVTTLSLEEKLSRVSEEDRERLVREYFRRKIVQLLTEQPAPPPGGPTDTPAPPPAPATPPAASTPPPTTPDAPEAEETEETIDDLLNKLHTKMVKKTTNERELAETWITFLFKLMSGAEPNQRGNIYKQLVFKLQQEIDK